MSYKGVRKFADILSSMQLARIELLGGDVNDMQLGQLLERMKDCVKEDFIRITNNFRTPEKP